MLINEKDVHREYLRQQEAAMDEEKRKEVQEAFEKIVSLQARRAEKGKREMAACQRRKNQLELNIFKIEKSRTCKGLGTTDRKVDKAPQSIFSASQHDVKDIPANEALYKNYIKQAVAAQEELADVFQNEDESLHILTQLMKGYDDKKIARYPIEQSILIKKAY